MSEIRFLENCKDTYTLPCPRGGVERVHQFDARSIAAINSAIGAGRPLMVRGEPGVGKTQLAEAAAEALERAFDWKYAQEHCEMNEIPNAAMILSTGKNLPRAPQGWVVLIDEIDKAESDVPNGLLEALGSGSFSPLGCSKPVESVEPAPLTIITTNEERILPDAFVRRCVVLHIQLPDLQHGNIKAFMDLMIERGQSHFQGQTDEKVLEKAAEILKDDRLAALERSLRPLPGQAEYLDMLRAVIRRYPSHYVNQLKLLDIVANYVVRKPGGMQTQEEIESTTTDEQADPTSPPTKAKRRQDRK